jgi:hypothetical protein
VGSDRHSDEDNDCASLTTTPGHHRRTPFQQSTATKRNAKLLLAYQRIHLTYLTRQGRPPLPYQNVTLSLPLRPLLLLLPPSNMPTGHMEEKRSKKRHEFLTQLEHDRRVRSVQRRKQNSRLTRRRKIRDCKGCCCLNDGVLLNGSGRLVKCLQENSDILFSIPV